ncbi:MAG: S8 family serine peptidase [Armatimonadetes bacterium]|nr:S8 family serine peptidase [Armatimonadota bacterium]
MFPAVASLCLASLNAPVMIDGELCHPTRLMVKAPVQATLAAASRIGAHIERRIPEIGWQVVTVPSGRLLASKRALEASTGVQLVEFDHAARLAYTPNDPLWGAQWHMRTIKADLAWDTSFGSSQVIVAVIDTGVLRTHEDLAANMWENTGEIPGNNIDDDNNGYVDDRYGWDFANGDNSPEDDYGHGTACAGIVAAVQDNNIGVTGVAPRARIMNLKATNNDGYLFDSYLAPAYIYGANMGARVFSMSYFSDRVSQSEKDAMNYAVAHGVLPVAAAGNSSSVIPFYPGAYENVLSVAAVDGNNNRSWFSDYGSWVDVAAPGEGLTTTAADGTYTGFGGTSGACPHVAGVAALLIGAKLNATPTEVRTAIEDTATLLNQPPYGEFSNYGLVNAQAALQALLNNPAPAKPAVVRYISTLGQGPGQSRIDPSNSVTARIYGRGFQALQNLAVKRNGVPAQIIARSRDWIDFKLVYRQPGDVSVWDGATLIAQVPNPAVKRTCRPLIEASAPSAWVDGGFREGLTDDGQFVVGHRDQDGNVILQGTFRNVLNSPSELRIRRSYAVGGGSEELQLYDWRSASYPYASWITIRSGPCLAQASTDTVSIADISRFIDVEGTVYFRLVATGTPENEAVNIDSLRLQDR